MTVVRNEIKPTENKNYIEKGILTANISLLVGFLFVYQAAYSNIFSKGSVLAALSLLIISLILILWHLYRAPIRVKLWDKYVNKVADDGARRINDYTDGIVEPLSRYDQRKKMEKVKFNSKKEFDGYMKNMEAVIRGEAEDTENILELPKKQRQAMNTITEALALQIINDAKEAKIKAYFKPLDEKHAKLKFIIDRFARKTKYHFFICGCMFLAISYYIEIISR